jgi:carbonic anhydrase
MHEQSPATGFETTRAANQAFAAAGHWRGTVAFPRLRLLVITCMDPRADPAHVLGLALGDAIVVRNSGGRVTPEVIDDVAFVGQIAEHVIPEGPLFEVAVIHHTECKAVAHGDPAASVASAVEALREAAAISPRVTVSGHVYDVATGLVETVVPATAATEIGV